MEKKRSRARARGERKVYVVKNNPHHHVNNGTHETVINLIGKMGLSIEIWHSLESPRFKICAVSDV